MPMLPKQQFSHPAHVKDNEIADIRDVDPTINNPVECHRNNNVIPMQLNNADIEQFVLVTDREVDMDVFVDLDVDEIFKEVNAATGNKSIDAKVKKIGYTEAELKQKVRDIVSMSSIQKYRNFEKNQVTKIRIF